VIVHYKPYTEPLWWLSSHTHLAHGYDFPQQIDRQKFTAFIRCSKHTGFCSSQLDDFSCLCNAADTQLCSGIHNPCHVLQALLTPPADHDYNLRDRPHNRPLPGCTSHLANYNFTVWMLFCGSYWLDFIYCLVFYLYRCTIAVWQLFY